MDASIRTLYGERKAPKHCNTRQVHDLSVPIFQLIIQVQRQVTEYRELLLTARFSEEGAKVAPKFDRARQKLVVMEQAASECLASCERLAKAFEQWDALMDEDEKIVADFLASKEPKTEPATEANKGAAK